MLSGKCVIVRITSARFKESNLPVFKLNQILVGAAVEAAAPLQTNHNPIKRLWPICLLNYRSHRRGAKRCFCHRPVSWAWSSSWTQNRAVKRAGLIPRNRRSPGVKNTGSTSTITSMKLPVDGSGAAADQQGTGNAGKTLFMFCAHDGFAASLKSVVFRLLNLPKCLMFRVV